MKTRWLVTLMVAIAFVLSMGLTVSAEPDDPTPEPEPPETWFPLTNESYKTTGTGGNNDPEGVYEWQMRGGDANYNTAPNANNTGSVPVRKDAGGHGNSIHYNYNFNTNACASCHQTHTAEGQSLLFANEATQVCLACHDGTAGGPSRNVLRVATNASGVNLNGAGTFAGTHSGNMSMHSVNSALQVSAAPGSFQGNDGDWDDTFSCVSCHSAHGSYSDAYLAFNPNNMAKVSVTEGGNAVFNAPVVGMDNIPSTGYAVVRGPASELDIPGYGDAIALRLYHNGRIDKNPWLYDYDWCLPPTCDPRKKTILGKLHKW
ncbi:MAG: hypothetical protein LRY73_19310 [Bacillus sp. (in: Bacteria)]|nr:hypothetical protein [Bacillus sp. (in: firmicutes)]